MAKRNAHIGSTLFAARSILVCIVHRLVPVASHYRLAPIITHKFGAACC
ncbi:MAG: hypothetical protein KGO02_11585 [Alphaproteobacteria bacterium]|nr:hypothetical protein [Alphaproteobacteria bacterium]